MARKFILIDQSVKKPGGHHYEYAGRILDAARARGFETLLLAHKDYRGKVDHDVRSAFTWTFWDNYRHYYMDAPRPRPPVFLRRLAKLRDKMSAFIRAIKRRLIFSSFGLALGRARHVSMKDILLRPVLSDDASSVKTSRPLLALARLAILAQSIQKRVKSLLVRLRLARFLRLIFLALFSPLLVLIFGILLARAGRTDPAARYASEFMRALKGERNLNETIIFVPNATAAELEGLLLIKRAMHTGADGRWAFLYRRPVFSGYLESYKGQMESARRHRVEFARLKTGAPDINVHFYTDTDELTEQYDLLGVYPFATLPVPVEPQDKRPPRSQDSLVIGYLGDVRDEKGFQHLPKLVESFVTPREEAPKTRFLFQANFNVPEGEPGSRYARSLLKAYDKDFVELAYGPFDSAEYNALLLRMDIVLIPYAAENYSARSSGVLMEALSSGLPVLAPAASWMAGLAEPARRRHLLELFSGKQDGVKRIAHIAAPYEKINDKTLSIDARANYVFIKLKFDRSFNGYVRFIMVSINEFDLPLETTRNAFKAIDGEVIAAFAKPPSSQLWWKAEPVEAEAQERPLKVEMSLFKAAASLPLFAGIALFDLPEDITSATHELVTFHTHHKQAASRLSDELRPLYDPAFLVEKLGRDAFGADAVETRRERALA